MLVPVDIVLPCYNPNDTWHKELLGFYNEAKALYALNFIVVNDGSVTGVAKTIELLQQHVPLKYISYTANKGKGYALRQGVQAAQSNIVVYTDVDFPFTSQSMIGVINAVINNECDIAAGYRSEKYYRKNMSFYRKILSKSFRFFIKSVLGMATTDTQCGLKGFNKTGREKFLLTTINRYLFDFEFIYISGKDKAVNIKPVEVQLKDNIVFSKMRFKILVQELFNLLRVLLFKKN